jgi:hypothetical protein
MHTEAEPESGAITLTNGIPHHAHRNCTARPSVPARTRNCVCVPAGTLPPVFDSRRPAVDADALVRNMAADQATVRQRVTEIASIGDREDGVEYLTGTATVAAIGDDALYSGVRVTMTADRDRTDEAPARYQCRGSGYPRTGPDRPVGAASGHGGNTYSRLPGRDSASRKADDGD